jgi:predicted extracellular nuclease
VQLERRDTGERLTVVVNHFRSQGGSDPAEGPLRVAQADFVGALVAELKALEPSTPVVVAGDLNDFEESEALTHLTAGGRLVDLSRRPGGERPYSYVFQGLSQVLDYLLVDPALAGRVREFRPVHVNVDFADPGPGSSGAAVRASDHDPVVAVIGP